MGTTMDSWITRAERRLMPTYGRLPVSFVRGEGCRLWDDAGHRYLDLAAGIGCCCLGHGEPRLAEAIGEQAARLIQVSNLYYTEPMVAVAEQLCAHSFGERVFFCNSGAEANEGAIKLARKRSRDRFGPGRYRILAFYGSFHGRTLATLSATGQTKVWKGFEPTVEGFDFADYGDLASVEAALTDAHCAVLVEPIQGEGGVVVPPAGFLEGLRQLCNQRDLTLIFDCVQTGMGRTGKLFCHQHEGVTPDVMTLAKGLGGGVPIGAIVATEAAGTVLTPGTHASTFGGNPLVCAAARAVLEALTEGGVVTNAAARGAQLFDGLAVIASRNEAIREVRGRGLMVGVALDRPVAPILDRLREAGIIALPAGPQILRLLPPLVISEAEVEEALAAIAAVLEER